MVIIKAFQDNLGAGIPLFKFIWSCTDWHLPDVVAGLITAFSFMIQTVEATAVRNGTYGWSRTIFTVRSSTASALTIFFVKLDISLDSLARIMENTTSPAVRVSHCGT